MTGWCAWCPRNCSRQESILDEILTPADADFDNSGLKVPSVLRLTRLAVLDGSLLLGSIGAISDERLKNVRQKLANWVAAEI